MYFRFYEMGTQGSPLPPSSKVNKRLVIYCCQLIEIFWFPLHVTQCDDQGITQSELPPLSFLLNEINSVPHTKSEYRYCRY